MSNVIGTIISVNDFLNNEVRNIYVRDKKGDDCEIFMLKALRKYFIPAYQRELRWNEKQLKELIYDVVNGKLFLGNIIVSEKTDGPCVQYEIIDGQQRITALRLIVKYIFESHSNPSAIEKYTLCDLIIDSFKDYIKLEQKSFTITDAEKTCYKETDDYHRIDSYIDLWKIINDHPLLKSNEQKRMFYLLFTECV